MKTLKLRKKSWHFWLMKFTWTERKAESFYNGCPYVWVTVFNCIVFPLTCLIKGLAELFYLFAYGLGFVFNKFIAEPSFNRFVRRVENDPIALYLIYHNEWNYESYEEMIEARVGWCLEPDSVSYSKLREAVHRIAEKKGISCKNQWIEGKGYINEMELYLEQFQEATEKFMDEFKEKKNREEEAWNRFKNRLASAIKFVGSIFAFIFNKITDFLKYITPDVNMKLFGKIAVWTKRVLIVVGLSICLLILIAGIHLLYDYLSGLTMPENFWRIVFSLAWTGVFMYLIYTVFIKPFFSEDSGKTKPNKTVKKIKEKASKVKEKYSLECPEIIWIDEK
jgi:hypothetical protein